MRYLKPLLLVLALGQTISSRGQKISRQHALADLTFLNQAVQHGHPVNYAPAFRADLHPILARVAALRQDSLSASEYRLVLSQALYRIGCVHTAVHKNPLVQAPPVSYFPLTLAVVNNKLIVARDSIYNLAGAEITALNGEPADTLLATVLRYWASDGGGTAFATAGFNKLSTSLISLYFGYPSAYTVATGTQIVTVPAGLKPSTPATAPLPPEAVLRTTTNALHIRQATAVLTIRSFAAADAAFFKKSMDYVQANGVSALVVDLRGNTGGNRDAAVALARHLVDTSFSYSIVQPRLHPFRYVNATGKLFLVLATLKYNVGDVFRGHRTPLGRAFTYRFKPSSRPYNGRLLVLTDGFTASSATMLTSWLRQHTSATFIGQPAGGGYNGNNGGAFLRLTLPHSRVEITFPAYRLVLDPRSTQRTGVVPDLMPQRSPTDVVSGKDVDMEAALSLLRAGAR